MNTIYMHTKGFYKVIKSSKKKNAMFMHVFCHTSVANLLKGPESIGSCSNQKPFLPSYFDI